LSTQPITRFEKRRRTTRGALLAVAHGLIVERGYDAVSIQDITDQADLGRGTFYLHFKDKEELVWAIIQDEFEKGAAALEAGLRGLSLDQRDYLGFMGFFSYIAAQRGLF
jgi:AcrR family transcriptional regulator